MQLKSKREAAELLDVSTRAIERAVRRGHLSVEYRDSKHGKQAWFNARELARYHQHRQMRHAVGFTSGIPSRPPGIGPDVGAIIPMVEIEPCPRKDKPQIGKANPVAVTDRLALTLTEATHLSGLPRNFITQCVRSGKLKTIKIGQAQYVKRLDLNKFLRGL